MNSSFSEKIRKKVEEVGFHKIGIAPAVSTSTTCVLAAAVIVVVCLLYLFTYVSYVF